MNPELLGGRYRVLRGLGQGGMARVVLAEDLSLGSQCALKIIHPHLSGNPELISRFRLELEVSRRLRHPGILEVCEFHEPGAGEPAFLSMEYLGGGDLKRRILREGPLPLPEIIRIGRACLEALGAAHAAGIVHRDIKPQNVLFALDGSPRLADFGLASVGAEAAASPRQAAAGTPDYCAPEIIRGETADGRADIYSLGATLFEAAAGRTPFPADSPYAAMRLKLEKAAPPVRTLRPELPAWFEAVLARALEREPRDRFQTAASFASALNEGGAYGTAAFSAIIAPAPDGRAPGPARLACPRCGRPIPRALSYCFRCSLAVPSLSPAESRAKAWSVMVTGSGKPGDKLDHEQRETCLRLVEREGVDAAGLRKRIPRAPFVLMRGLSRASAESMAEALGASGLEALSLGPDSPRELRDKARQAQAKRLTSLLPRIYAVILMSSSYLFSNLSNLARVPSLIPIAIGLFLTVPPLVLAVSGRRAFARLQGAAPGDPALLEAARALTTPSVRDIVESVAAKADAIEARIAELEGLDARAKAALSLDLREALEGFGRAAQETERLALAAGAFTRSDQAAREGAADPGAREALRRTDEMRASLLAYSAAMDSCLLGFSGVDASAASGEINALEALARRAGDLTAAYREIGEGRGAAEEGA
jgi:hypothetical protein